MLSLGNMPGCTYKDRVNITFSFKLKIIKYVKSF